ncbi:MAG: 50S ribosomal protein L1 [Dehalococcoidia bacterium]|jgi:large subunit ribosomal protein L1|nr:50S ribosomal protein L1 [Dehalococcoidia bacterium]MDP6511428.1 50S ribosomal protein L1 [Dehalococcoidia bacterium]MDP6783472.1 50S ribosomal protein L1 [Dehalococcoidia bacterium]
MTHRGKRYQEAAKVVEKDRLYEPLEAVQVAKKASSVKFDETVELHLRTNLDPRKADHQLRGLAMLPHGMGKEVKVLAFAQGEASTIAEQAGADVVGGDELVKQVEGGFLDFDIAFATQDMMGRVGKLGKILGRRGLMPNPKSGTVVAPQDMQRAIQEAKRGRVEFRLDRTSIIHVPIGKISFDEEKLVENMAALVEAVTKARPSGAKGQFIKSLYLTSTMSPGIKLDPRHTLSLTTV